MSNTHRSKSRTVVFSLVPLIFILVILEIAGRILYPFDPDGRAMVMARRDPRLNLSYFSQGTDAKAILFDMYRMDKRYLPFLGYLGAPNSRLPTISTNALGFRDRAIAPRQPKEFRVLLLGGSTAWGLGASSNDHTISANLERTLNQRGDGIRYRVMNAAYLGYIARQEMTVLTGFMEDFDPDLVVSLTGYNDLTTMIHGTGEIFDRPETRELGEAVTRVLRPMNTTTALRKVAGSLGIWRLVVYFREVRQVSAPKAGEYAFDQASSDKWVPRVAEMYKIMARFSGDHGRRYVIALQPDIETTRKRMGAEEAKLRSAARTGSTGFAAAYASYRRNLAAALGATDDAQFIDLGGAFDAVSEPVFIDGCHLTDRGYAHLAEVLADRISWPAGGS
ncbi:MAG: hypothetical protein BGP20_01100 [Thiobacillus sp. 63-78]|uniref:GDSL-type esterase/lipase family protein n=1 Tax=Thiobacillus sp. 63-78 TaxID=1895859 RepID=UPI000964572E|nr:GDSL-type esterase/lipase family protein [Thiobacillus sp. 63-78]MBN8762315.1 hypothetical protein [Thiobacillus sp.]MBN8774378.1 hypothetical protein [Thiobacillus sp.]OJZ16156.1 MAG: hypothetical protein BGP20_01100 [Thiobacillus sp. 63-78]